MSQSFDSKIAVVTGAASGIGLTVARHFADRGARIVGVDVNERVGELMAELPGAGHHGFVKDLTRPDAASETIAETGSARRARSTPEYPAPRRSAPVRAALATASARFV